MPTPSLLIVPARWKTGNPGKLYSQIPTNGDGDFNVTGVITGATNAGTRVNNLGYIEPITTSGTPRLDYYTSSGTPGCPALLVEPSAQNLFLQSAGFEVSGNWSPTSTTVTTGSTTAFTAPDNSTDADLITATGSGSSFIGQNTTIASGTYTISVFAKAGNYGLFRIGNVLSAARAAWFNLNAGVVTGTVNGGTASMQNYGNGWYRCIYTSSGMVSGNTFFAPSDAPNSTNAVSGSSIYFWGAQLETGSVATSYIPTTTGSVTRNADVISVSGAVSGSIGQTEGTIYAEVDVRTFASSAARRIVSLRVDGSNLLSLEINAASTNIEFVATSGGVSVNTVASGLTAGITKIAVGYNSAASGTVLYVNGTLRDAKTIAIPNLSAAVFGLGVRGDGGAGTQLNDRIRAAALYTTRLTNAELMLLTMPGNNTYLPQAIWDNYLSRTGNAELPDCLYTRHADLLDV